MLAAAVTVVMTTATAVLEASCFCGAVRLKVKDATAKPPISVSICHCETCRKLTGAPMLANVMLPADRLEVVNTEGNADATDSYLVASQTSKHVTRHRCSKCYSPVYAMLGKGRVVVPSSLFAPPHPETWTPQHHLYYERRVTDVHDTLPKYRTHYGSALFGDETGTPSADDAAGAR